MLQRYKVEPKTPLGRVGYAILCVLSVLILGALLLLPPILFILVYGDSWWELIFLVYLLMVPGYLEILALLDAVHYLVRRRTGTVAPSKWGDWLRGLYAFFGIQCWWVILLLVQTNLTNWELKRRLDDLSQVGTQIYLWAGLLIGCLWLADVIRKIAEKRRDKKQAQAMDQRDWDEFMGRS